MMTTDNTVRQAKPPAWRASLRQYAPGVMFAVLLGLAASFLSDHYGGPPMLFALLLGMAFHFVSQEPRFAEGIGLSAKQVLRVGVALLGARITIDQIMGLGWVVPAGVAVAVVLTIGFGALGAHVLGLRRRFGVLSAGAVAICGASAAAAIAAVLPRHESHERDTAFTIIGVTTLSTVAMVLYPMVATALGFDGTQTGIFLGGTIHDVAQVVGAGYSVSTEAGDTATIVKLLRVALLVPVVLAVSLGSRRMAGGTGTSKGLIPGFLAAFLVLVALNSLGVLPEWARAAMATASGWCIVTAIAALGVKTSLASMAAVGHRAIGLIVAETVFIAVLIAALLAFS
ncbi:MAG TPA: putative sulfate exporter family transporter [Azospirillaceae bacterium]|nr:putative sulfate exporter family transporter [Azospirillaceae bacterium]